MHYILTFKDKISIFIDEMHSCQNCNCMAKANKTFCKTLIHQPQIKLLYNFVLFKKHGENL